MIRPCFGTHDGTTIAYSSLNDSMMLRATPSQRSRHAMRSLLGRHRRGSLASETLADRSHSTGLLVYGLHIIARWGSRPILRRLWSLEGVDLAIEPPSDSDEGFTV